MGAIIGRIMYIVTGGAGFIGSNLVRALCERGKEVIVVDDLTDGRKFLNISEYGISDYLDKDEFGRLARNYPNFAGRPEAIFHQGACSDTTQWDGRYMMETNYAYSKHVFDYAQHHEAALLYASSASVYGAGPVFKEERKYEAPLNVYAYSKCLFDRFVETKLSLGQVSNQVVGLRYFNVYGPGESHKGKMASIAWQLYQRVISNQSVDLFEGCDGYADGEQRRDFVYVDDVVDVNLWFLDNPDRSGIYNLGTGFSQTFNDVANAVTSWFGSGDINYIPFPAHLRGRYQSFTEADISALRTCGYKRPFLSVQEGVQRYLDVLAGKSF